MWLVGLWPLSRSSVMWAKLDFALTITSIAALSVTYLSIRALDLPRTLALIQLGGTLSACVGLCGLAVGLGARLPSYRENNIGRIASGLGGTVNLIASNVRGPSVPLYSNGARVSELFSMGPLSGQQGLNFTAWSYLDAFSVGVHACREHVPDVRSLADGMVVELEMLRHDVPGQ